MWKTSAHTLHFLDIELPPTEMDGRIFLLICHVHSVHRQNGSIRMGCVWLFVAFCCQFVAMATNFVVRGAALYQAIRRAY